MAGPPVERVVEVQQRLVELSDLVEQDPARTLVAIQPLIEETSSWPNRRAFLWAAQVACQAYRFLDRLNEAVGMAVAAERIAESTAPELVAHLALEHGTALRQLGDATAARRPLARALAAFDAEGDQSGAATTLVELGVTTRLLGDVESSLVDLADAVRRADAVGFDRTARRARRETGVSLRHAGRARESVDLLTTVLADEPPGSHGRANTLNELAASEVQLTVLGEAQAHYSEAGDLYAVHGDHLGMGNVARALGNITGQLSRYAEAGAHLDEALAAYRRGGYRRSEANALWDRALVRLAVGDRGRAMEDAVASWRTFVRFDDDLGASGALRTLAQVANATGRASLRDRALARSLRLARRLDAALAVANTLLHITVISDEPATGLGHAAEAVAIYERLEQPVGVMQAASRAAEHALASDAPAAALHWASVAMEAVATGRWRMRAAVDRADYGYTASQATSRLYGVLAALRSPEANVLACRLVAEDGPAALTHLARTGRPARLPSGAKDTLDRLAGTDDPLLRGVQLRRLAATLAVLDEHERTPDGVLDGLLGDLGPDDALLITGAPVHGLAIPALWATATTGPLFVLLPLDEPHVDAIDDLGRLTGESVDDLQLLWERRRTRGWTRRLADALLPPAARDWLDAGTLRRLRLCVHQSLAHVPFEALTVGDVPLGTVAAVERVPARVTPSRPHLSRDLLAYADPAIDTARERRALDIDVGRHPGDFRAALGPHQLAWLCCHGHAGIDLDAKLATTQGERVLDAGDILRRDLTGSTVVMETCWSGRHFGRPFAEGLTLVTCTLLAGASAVATGLFPIPAHPACTGTIAAHLLQAVRRGRPLPDALRDARRAYLDSRPDRIQLATPEGRSVTIPADAPLTWAGLIAIS